jgi:hypothetical protein
MASGGDGDEVGERKQVRPIEKNASATTLVFILEPKPALFYS